MTGEGTVGWGEVVRITAVRLSRGGVTNANQEARWLAEEVSGIASGALDSETDTPATAAAVARLDTLVERRCGGEPLQYVLGHWPFRTLDLMVDRRVLIPRPETEAVVERALSELDTLSAAHPGRSLVVVDLGTGSGAMALSIATERPAVTVIATDVSADALAVAAANLAGLGMAGHGVTLAHGSWFDALAETQAVPGELDLVVANPPYVAVGDALPPEVVDFEPSGALVAGAAGTEDLVAIIDGARHWLADGGVLVAECAPTQAAELVEHALVAGYSHAEMGKDLTGRDRMVVARWGGS